MSDGTDEEKVAFNKKTSGVELSALDQVNSLSLIIATFNHPGWEKGGTGFQRPR